MAPKLTTLAIAILACTGSTTAKTYSLQETYDSTNFFDADKFKFFESKFGTDNNNNVDPNYGFINYYGKENAMKNGLVSTQGGEVYIGVDHKATSWPIGGRPSVRLESSKQYRKGLFIGRFTHLPANKCGSWPAFWLFGNSWPNGGEIDMYENFNNARYNAPTFHTGNTEDVGTCNLDPLLSTGTIRRTSCDHDPSNSGCGVNDTKGPYGTKSGGTIATEWTSDYIKIYTWYNGFQPKDIDSDYPDTSTWGLPVTWLKNSNCPIDRHFGPQTLTLNIDFCGAAAGNDYLWKTMCEAETGERHCADYVRKNPSAFSDVYFKVKDIRYFTESDGRPTTTKASSTSAATSTSSSMKSSITSPAISSSSSLKTSSTGSSMKTSSTSPITRSSSSTKTSSSSSATSSSSSIKTSSSSSSMKTSSSSSSASTSSATSISSSMKTSSSSSSASTSSATSTSSSMKSSSSSPAASTHSTIKTSGSSSITSSTSSIIVSSSSPVTKPSSATSSSSSKGSAIASSSSTISSQKSTSPDSTSAGNGSPTGVTDTTSATISSTAAASTLSATSNAEISSSSTSDAVTSPMVSEPAFTSDSPTSKSVLTPSNAPSSSARMTTSTVYTTTVYTVSQCPPSVTNCPERVHVTTEVVPAYTTVCPVDDTNKVETAKTVPGDAETLTSKVTKVYTVTSCPPSVTDCPVGALTTEIVATTFCPGGCDASNEPSHATETRSSKMPVATPPAQTMATPCEGEGCHGTASNSGVAHHGTGGCNGKDCPPAATQTLSGSVCVGQDCHAIASSGSGSVFSATAILGSVLACMLAL